jgi:hypothetical protein
MKDDKDDFWDVSRLVPKKKSAVPPFSTKEKLVTVTISGDEPSSEGTMLTRPENIEGTEEIVREYDNGFIKEVKITRLVDKFDFYGNFRKAALLYFDFKTPKCEFATFYSYMPQYSQFNTAQKNFYFYWRDCVRRGKYIKSDYSYFYLYVYEILNLPDKIEPKKGLDMLVDLWISYRGELPNIDSNMALWVQDYCLIYGLECPMDKIGYFIFDIINATNFKEFYLSDATLMGEDGVNAMLAYLSDYDWQKGRYAGGDNKAAYRKHMLSAMGRIIDLLWKSGELSNRSQSTERISRSAFRGSLCTHSVKSRLEIEFIPCGKSENLRISVTAAIRYTENLLRAALGVKSRLAVISLPNEFKKLIDEYFDGYYKRVNRERIKANIPEYERMYDAENTGLSINGADEIERASWITTARLVVDEAEPEDALPVSSEEVAVAIEYSNNTAPLCREEDTYDLSGEEIKLLYALLIGDDVGIRDICREIGDELLTVAERINEAFSDGFGDIILDFCSDNVTVIEDYKEEIKEWLMKRMK